MFLALLRLPHIRLREPLAHHARGLLHYFLSAALFHVLIAVGGMVLVCAAIAALSLVVRAQRGRRGRG